MLLKDQIKVLLVEDNPGDAQLIKEALKESSYREATLFLADSIAGAKQFATENILLLLLDLGLPDSNGLDTVQFIRNDFPDSALIILTGLEDETMAVEALRMGAQNYLTKDGINADTLSRTIRYSLERHDFIERLKAKQEELTQSNLLLEKSEKHFRAIIENSTDGITVISAEGIVLDMSPSGRKILGYHENEIIVKNRPDLIHPEDQKIVFKAFDDIITDPANIKLIEYRHQMPDGRYKWLECSFKNLLREPYLHAIVLNYRDITERKMAEENVRDSQATLQAILENTSDSIWLVDKDYKLLFSNSHFTDFVRQLAHRSIELGDNIKNFIPDSYKESLIQLCERAFKGEQFSVEQIRDYNGTEIILEYFFNPIRNARNEVTGLSVFMHNITSRKMAERKLADSEYQYRSLIEQASDAIFIANHAGKYIDVNSSASKLLGYSCKELLTMSVKDILFDEELIQRLPQRFESLTKGEDKVREVRLKRKDGTAVDVESISKMLADGRFVGIVRDITDRKKAERILAESENRLRTIIETEPECVKLLGLNGELIEMNPAGLAMIEAESFEQVLGKSMLGLIKEPYRKAFEALTKNVVKGATGTLEFEITGLKGTNRWLETHATPMKDIEGNIAFLLGVTRDITERKKAEHEMALLINNTEESFILMDRNLTIVSFNNQFFNLYKKYLGLTVQKGDSILAYAQPERKAALATLYEKVLAGSTEKSEIAIPTLDGELKRFSIKYTPAKDNSNDIIGVFVTAIDITDLKKAEELEEFERRDKEALINNTDDLIWSVTKDYKLIAANHAFLYSMHLSSKVVLKNGDSLMLHGIIPPDTLAFWKDLYDQALLGKSFKREIHNPPSLESEEFWTETSFNPIFNGDQVEAIACYARNITEKKIADDLLRKSEARLTEAQAVAKVGSWETDLATLKVVWSLETYRIFEITPENLSLTHTTFLKYVHPEDIALVDSSFKRSLQKNTINTIQHRVITDNGKLKWVEERWGIFRDAEGNPIRAVGTTQDITKRKKTEEKIQRSETELREAQKLAQVGSWNFDFEADRLTWSDELYNVFDTNHETFLETHGSFVHLVDEQDRDFVRQTIMRAQRNGISFDIEYHITTGKGEQRVIHERGYAERNKEGKIIRLFGTAQNITERKKAEEQIKMEKLFSDSLINSLPGIFYLYDKSGKFARWNKNLETISGYDTTEIAGMHPFDFYDEDEKQLIKTKIEKIFTIGSDELTAHFYTKEKKKIPYYFKGHKISLNGNDYLIGVGIDVTERVRSEKALLEYTREIQKLTAYLDQVREEERTRIAREIHDELGQQLTGLKMDVSWIAKKIPTDDKTLETKLAGMLLLLDETVKSIRRISSDLRPSILDDLGLIAALEWQSHEFEKRSEIKCHFKTNVEDLDINRTLATSIFRIYQEALTNIMRHAKAAHIEVTVKQTKTDFVILVKDDGEGFNAEAVKEKQTLGLIGMRERALMVGGELLIHSELNKGTSVMLKIPRRLLT